MQKVIGNWVLPALTLVAGILGLSAIFFGKDEYGIVTFGGFHTPVWLYMVIVGVFILIGGFYYYYYGHKRKLLKSWE